MSALCVLSARIELEARAQPSMECFDYLRAHCVDPRRMSGFVGAFGVIPIIACGAGRFDFTDTDQGPPGFICEAYGEDGETVIDLVGWLLDRPAEVMTMFGRCGLLGASEAMCPATYFMGSPLQMHATPLGWLKAGCRGAAIITPHLAGRALLDLPGKIAAQDHAHGREIAQMIASVVDRHKVIVPSSMKRAA